MFQAQRAGSHEVLEIDQVGARDNFFDLGGHSLLAGEVQVRIQEELGIDVLLRLLFDAETLSELAEEVERIVTEDAEVAPA